MPIAAPLQRLCHGPHWKLIILIVAALCTWRILLYFTQLRNGSMPNQRVTFTGVGFHSYYSSNVETEKHHGPYILTMEYGGQQGAGMRALVLQQCFVSNLDIHAYIVEPFVVNSVLGHRCQDPNAKQAAILKFSDMFDIDNFNQESIKSGYAPLVEWEFFMNNAPNTTILVELQSGGQKGTQTVFDVSNTRASSCYKGEQYPLNLVNVTICVVRIVKICCVFTKDSTHLSNSGDIATIEELQHGIFGKWESEKVNIVFWYWTSFWHVPVTCGQGPLLIGKVFPSKQVLKHVHRYQELFLRSKRVVAFVLRFEHLIFKNYNTTTCLSNFREAPNRFKKILSNASIFVAADVGKFKSSTWEIDTYPLVVKVDHKSGKEVYGSFVNALSDFIGHYWKFEEWNSSFDQITDGIEDAGYVATLQKSIASMADCLIFLTKGESNFQNLVVAEYKKHHPIPSEQCIHYICTKDCQNCFKLYRNVKKVLT